MREINKEVKLLTPLIQNREIWICRRIPGNKILAVAYARIDIINHLKSLCQFVDITSETKDETQGQYRTKTVNETYEFTIQKTKILMNVPSK